MCLDELVTVQAEYMPRHRWNGWLACPWIDAWSVVTVLDLINADPYGDADSGYEYDFREDGALMLTDRQYRAEGGGEDATDTLVPTVDGLYALGAYGWIWSEDTDENGDH